MPRNNLKKVRNIYRSQGLKGLSIKLKYYAKVRIGDGFISGDKEINLEDKNLREEYSFTSNELFQITSKDIENSNQSINKGPLKKIKSATWFVPYYDHFGFNGIQTIFRTMDKLSKEGVLNRIVFYDNPSMDVKKVHADIEQYFPSLTNYEIVVFNDDKIKSLDKLPYSDIAFCTLWLSAYLLVRFNNTKKKYYFIQDYEPLFYVAGSTYALAESTYRFGFTAIVNTPGLYDMVRDTHGMTGTSFIPTVNHNLYFSKNRDSGGRVRIFFYARPYNPRNAFNLGIQTIKRLIDNYGDKIEVITAGAEWDEAAYGLAGRITNMGLIKTLQEVADLYRTCDIGFAYMMNKHTTYQMMEYTASGMATVMNNNEYHHWLHKDGVNCLLAEASPAAMAEKIGHLIEDETLRKKLLNNAKKSISTDWDSQMDGIWNYIQGN